MSNEISIEALKEKTVGEVCELVKQARNLPEGFKVAYKKPEENYAEKLIEEL